jgi:hypothetical protein
MNNQTNGFTFNNFSADTNTAEMNLFYEDDAGYNYDQLMYCICFRFN